MLKVWKIDNTNKLIVACTKFLWIEVKQSKCFTGHGMKANRGSKCTPPFIIKLGTRWRKVVNFTPRPLHPREKTDTHLIGGWVGPRALLDVSRREKSLEHTGIRTRGEKCRWMVTPVDLSCWKTTVSWLGVSLNAVARTDTDSRDGSITIFHCLACSLHTVTYCGGGCCLKHWLLPLLEMTVGENSVLETKIKNTSLWKRVIYYPEINKGIFLLFKASRRHLGLNDPSI
jgi:hypothetical protein